MASFSVGSLTFHFPDEWRVEKYDEWAYYRNQLSRLRDGIKAVDLVGLDPDSKTVWLIEVKDYRSNRRTKPIDLNLEVAAKVLDTVAAMLPASIRANDDEEQSAARAALKSRDIRVVLHLESGPRKSPLFSPRLDQANVKQKLRERVKAIDPHPLVTDSSSQGLRWTVT